MGRASRYGMHTNVEESVSAVGVALVACSGAGKGGEESAESGDEEVVNLDHFCSTCILLD